MAVARTRVPRSCRPTIMPSTSGPISEFQRCTDPRAGGRSHRVGPRRQSGFAVAPADAGARTRTHIGIRPAFGARIFLAAQDPNQVQPWHGAQRVHNNVHLGLDRERRLVALRTRRRRWESGHPWRRNTGGRRGSAVSVGQRNGHPFFTCVRTRAVPPCDRAAAAAAFDTQGFGRATRCARGLH